MPRSSSKSKKGPDGMGSIRKVERTIKGKTYTYFEARYSVGFDPGTGKQIQRSISGKSKTEVAKKLREALTAVDAGMYVEPNRMTLSEWLDQWSADYLVGLKPLTVSSYVTCIQNHLKPGLGAVRLQDLDTRTILPSACRIWILERSKGSTTALVCRCPTEMHYRPRP